jgi:hypothetical protein
MNEAIAPDLPDATVGSPKTERPPERAGHPPGARSDPTSVHPSGAAVYRSGSPSQIRAGNSLPLGISACAVAVLLIAIGYAVARDRAEETVLATSLYWAGQLLLFGSTTAMVLARRRSTVVLTSAVLAFTAAQYAVKVLYSPIRLKFPDELQHEQSMLGMLATGRLFPTNYSLPISPLYPGLEAAAVGFVEVLGMPVHVAELLVAGLAHMLLAAAVLVLMRLLIRRRDLASLGTLAYCFGSYQAFYNSMFVYQALALPLAVLAVVQVLAILRGDRVLGRLVTAAGLSFCVVITHHVTAFFTALVLIAIATFSFLHPAYRRRAPWATLAAVASSAFLTAWVLSVAPATLGYLGEPYSKFVGTLGAAGHQISTPGEGQPVFERPFTYGAVILTLSMLALLSIVAWRRGNKATAVVAATAASLQLLVVAIRFAVSDGQELAGRAQNYLALYTSIGVAVCLGLLLHGYSRYGKIAVSSILSVLFVGGIVSGWPPPYERLPGQYQVDAFESSVDPHAVAAAEWTRSHIGPGNRFASDFGNLAVIGTLGEQFPISSSYSELFYRYSYDSRDALLVQNDEIQFILVDMRLSQQLPPPDSYSYFTNDSRAGTHLNPLDPEVLRKFSYMPGVGCLYDDGTIQIYDLRGSSYAY